MRETQESSSTETFEKPVSISHLVHTLRAYLPAIAMGMAVIMLAYIIVATAVYLLLPSQLVTSQSFRLDFPGSDRGLYPNGSKFSTSEIVSSPILLKVFNQNNLGRFVKFADFSRSLVVLESNPALESLASDYQARLSDPRLTPIDRERIQREYESRSASISKGQYTLHYMRTTRGSEIPGVLVRKVLDDVLTEWANFVANEQHVMEYRLAVLSPEVVTSAALDGNNPTVNIDMLRAKILRVMANLEQIRRLPSAELARTEREAMSLRDISVRLDEIVRFRLEPLLRHTAAAGLDDRGETIRFLESQLAYDLRMLDAQQRIAEAAFNTLALYRAGKPNPDQVGGASGRPGTNGSPETVMPQLSDSFLDRLMELTSNAGDRVYRQSLADAYQAASLAVVPLQESVVYYQSILAALRSGHQGEKLSRDVVDQQIVASRNEVRLLVTRMQEIHRALSRNLNPSTVLLTRTGVPVARVSRPLSDKKLVLYGVLTAFLALPLLILLSLLHNRVREEEASDGTLPDRGSALNEESTAHEKRTPGGGQAAARSSV